MDNRGFIEVETLMLSTIAGGASKTIYNSQLDRYVPKNSARTIFKESHSSRSWKSIWYVRTFRNEGMSVRHQNLQHDIWSFADYNDMMDICENLIASVCEK